MKALLFIGTPPRGGFIVESKYITNCEKSKRCKGKNTPSRKDKIYKVFRFFGQEWRKSVDFLYKIMYYMMRYAYLHTYYGQKGENVDDKKIFK